jgi:hypothetical protein
MISSWGSSTETAGCADIKYLQNYEQRIIQLNAHHKLLANFLVICSRPSYHMLPCGNGVEGLIYLLQQNRKPMQVFPSFL